MAHLTPRPPTPSAQSQQSPSTQRATVCDETLASPPSGRKSPVLIKSPVVRRFNEFMKAAKELNIEVNPSAEILETAFDVYITENQIKAYSLDVDEGLLRKTFYDDMSPMERADYVDTAACEELRSPEATPRASPAKKRH
jgi:hypothetical protein